MKDMFNPACPFRIIHPITGYPHRKITSGWLDCGELRDQQSPDMF